MPRPAPAPELSTLTVRGTPRQLGQAQGEHWRGAVQEVCEARLASTVRWAAERGVTWTPTALLAAMPRYLAAHEAYDPDVWEEFLGLAEGAGVTPAALLIGNGYTDVRDATVHAAADLTGCTTCSALPAATADGRVLVGQTWDMDASMLPYVYLCRREPTRGPATLGVTTCGCLSLIGLNEHGVAVGNSNITPRDARPGVIYLALIHRALAARTRAEAAAAITGAHRASGHHYYVAEAAGVTHLETTATCWVELPRDGDVHTQSNDYRHEGFAEVAVPPLPAGRSIERRTALAGHLAARRPLTPAGLCDALAADDVRVAVAGVAITCAAVVMDPAGRRLWATHGPPAAGLWREFAL